MDITKMGKMWLFGIAGGLLIVLGYFAAMLVPQDPAIALALNLLGVVADFIFIVLFAWHLWNLAKERRAKRNIAR